MIVDFPADIRGSTVGATAEPGEADACVRSGRIHSVWSTFKLNRSKQMQVYLPVTKGAQYLKSLCITVVKGESIMSAELVSGSGPVGRPYSFGFSAQAGETYHIGVTGGALRRDPDEGTFRYFLGPGDSNDGDYAVYDCLQQAKDLRFNGRLIEGYRKQIRKAAAKGDQEAGHLAQRYLESQLRKRRQLKKELKDYCS